MTAVTNRRTPAPVHRFTVPPVNDNDLGGSWKKALARYRDYFDADLPLMLLGDPDTLTGLAADAYLKMTAEHARIVALQRSREDGAVKTTARKAFAMPNDPALSNAVRDAIDRAQSAADDERLDRLVHRAIRSGDKTQAEGAVHVLADLRQRDIVGNPTPAAELLDAITNEWPDIGDRLAAWRRAIDERESSRSVLSMMTTQLQRPGVPNQLHRIRHSEWAIKQAADYVVNL